ncbi:chaperone protein dnaJ 10-like [Dorcoceras hygrometricum]|uniref:Chaperone protein dnaJ 10-like n=1 Tax=Dorcoceras hygrometricum TaxID=472368 RepID=A0A2Z7AWI1_9LAMI|nr:chaperone protein dnaJ 10-like [Dorcoceras hygrometricum]
MDADDLPTISGNSVVDNKALFRKVFGSEIFEDYVGQLVLLGSPPPEFDPNLSPEVQKPKLDEIMKAVREDRELKLVETLKDRLQLCVEGKNNELVKWAKSEVERLSQQAFGVALLRIIGYMYSRKAAKEIEKRKRFMKILFVGEWLRDKRHTRKSRAAASSAAVSYIKLQEHWKNFDIEDVKDEKASKVAKEIQDSMLNSFWKMNVADIEMTLSHVCQMVLKDSSASKDVLLLRAKGMKKIGKIFQAVKAR